MKSYDPSQDGGPYIRGKLVGSNPSVAATIIGLVTLTDCKETAISG
jgi:hypothetical protein